MRVHALPACTACGSDQCKSFDLGAGHLLKQCRECETVSALEYADPSEIYTDGYLFGKTDFGLDVRDPEFQEYLLRVGHRRFELIESVSSERETFLDVGCGSGEVLQAGRERGWHVQGVEPEATGATMARERGLNVEIAMLEDTGLQERFYDVVAAFHVLEHVPDPVGFLKMLARWARPGGLVVVEVPNFASFQRRRLAEGWPMLRPLEHLTHFTPATLERAVGGAGLKPIITRSPVYLGPPQNLHFALADLGRAGRFRHLMRPLSRARPVNGSTARYPTRAGWSLLRALEAGYDRRGIGAVAFCIGKVTP